MNKDERRSKKIEQARDKLKARSKLLLTWLHYSKIGLYSTTHPIAL